jgi:hypothetical protein
MVVVEVVHIKLGHLLVEQVVAVPAQVQVVGELLELMV